MSACGVPGGYILVLRVAVLGCLVCRLANPRVLGVGLGGDVMELFPRFRSYGRADQCGPRSLIEGQEPTTEGRPRRHQEERQPPPGWRKRHP